MNGIAAALLGLFAGLAVATIGALVTDRLQHGNWFWEAK